MATKRIKFGGCLAAPLSRLRRCPKLKFKLLPPPNIHLISKYYAEIQEELRMLDLALDRVRRMLREAAEPKLRKKVKR